MILSAYLGIPNLTDVGFQFFNTLETAIGARITSGVISSGTGYYSTNVEVPTGAASVRWDSMGTLGAAASEYFNTVTPQPAAGDSTLCMVYGFIQTPQGIPAASAELQFKLVSPAGLKDAAGRLIHGRQVNASTNSSGYIHVLLERNDRLNPPGSTWTVTAPSIGLTAPQSFSLAALTFNLASVTG